MFRLNKMKENINRIIGCLELKSYYMHVPIFLLHTKLEFFVVQKCNACKIDIFIWIN